MKLGFIPRIPCYPHLNEHPVPEEFKILYHYTSWSLASHHYHLLWHLPRCYFLQGPRLHDEACSMGDRGQEPMRTNRICVAIDTEAALFYGIRLVETVTSARTG